MKKKLVCISLVLLLDILLMPVVLKLLILILSKRDLFLGVWELVEILQKGPWEIHKLLVVDKVFLKMWLVMQPLVLALLGIILTHESKKTGDMPETAGKGEYGTSRFLSEKEVEKRFLTWRYPENLAQGGLVLGSTMQGMTYKFWLDDQDTHAITIGSTGSGKTLRVTMPSLWALSHGGESMVITDPKAEIYGKTEGFLRHKGYKIVMLDFRDMRKSLNCWNPLSPVNMAFGEGDDKAVEKAWDIANMFVYQRPQGNSDPIWADGEESTLASLILAVVYGAEREEQKNLASVYTTLFRLGRPDPEMDNQVPLDIYINQQLPLNHPAQAAFGTACLAPYRTRASFFTGASSKLRLWADNSVACATAIQDHDLAGPGKEKTAVFLIIPDEKSTRNFLASLYIDQTYQALVEEADKYEGKLPVRVNFLLDEFGNLPGIKDFDKKITVARSRNIRFLLAIQGLDQLKTQYGNAANTISGNCRTWIYLLTADYDTAKVLSQKVGHYTIRTESRSTSTRTRDTSEGYSRGLTGRALLMPDEILRWNVKYPGKSLIIRAGDYPAILNAPFLSDTPIEGEFEKCSSSSEKLSCKKGIPKDFLWVPQVTGMKKEGSEQKQDLVTTEKELEDL